MKILICLTLTFCCSLAAERPNILLILADDMGYGDLSLTGSEVIRTPHIDSLAASGVFCSQAYIPSSVCSPSRAGILTGRDPRRFGYEGNLNMGAEGYATRPELLGLPVTEHTLADHLKAAGYATALVGKWHQGTSAPFHPNRRGFDHFVGMLSGSHDYFPTAEENRLEANGEPLKEFPSPYLTDFFTDEAIAWIDKQKTAETAETAKPWFLFASYNAPHTPMQATEEDLALYAHVENPRRRTYAAMMHALDRGVGRLLAHLRESGAEENTMVIFFSDNGGATDNGSWSGPFGGCKGSMREGGIRTPFFLSWPAGLPKGTTYAEPVSALDLLPTFLAAAGAEPLPLQEAPSHEDPKNRDLATKRYGAYDGINLLPLLQNENSETPERLLFWRLQGQSAVLAGDHKLVKLSHRPAQLLVPEEDPREENDLAAQEPKKLAELFRLLGEWESSLATVPLWDSSPVWTGDSAKIYDRTPIPEPK